MPPKKVRDIIRDRICFADAMNYVQVGFGNTLVPKSFHPDSRARGLKPATFWRCQARTVAGWP